MKQNTFQLETLTCPSCAAKIEAAIKKVEGVEKVEVLFTSSRVRVSYDETRLEASKVKQTIEALGYDVLNVK